MAAGCTDVINVEGGTMAWDQAGLPVVRCKKAISLERQVRIAAGALALTGSVLSFVHPYWVGLPGFVGAGLMFAGITNTCGIPIRSNSLRCVGLAKSTLPLQVPRELHLRLVLHVLPGVFRIR